MTGKRPAIIADIINKEQNKINNNNKRDEQQQDKEEIKQKEPFIVSRERAHYLELSGNKLEWINENDFYFKGRLCSIQDIVI